MAVASVLFDIRAGIAKLNQDFARAEATVQAGMQRISGIMRRAAIGLGAALGARAIASLATTTGQAAAELQDMAQRTGVAANSLAALRYGAEQSGASFNNLQRGLKNISERASEVAAGIDRYRAQYERFGISLVDASGHARNADEVLADVADRLAAMPDGAAKMEAAMRLVGVEAGPRLLPMLNQGRAGLEQFRREAEGLGLAMGNEAIKALADFDTATGKLRQASTSTGRALIAGFAQPMQAVAERLVEVTSSTERFATMKEKAAQIAEVALHVIDGLAATLGYMLEPLRDLLPTTKELVDAFRGIKTSAHEGSAAMNAFAVALKAVRSVGVLVGGLLDWIGKALGGLGAALIELVSGNFRQAFEIAKDVGKDIWDSSLQVEQKLADTWTRSARDTVDQASQMSTGLVSALQRVREGTDQTTRTMQTFTQVTKQSAAEAAKAAKEAERLARTLRDNALETQQLIAQSMGQTTQVMRLELEAQLNTIKDMHADGLLSEEDYQRRREALTKLTEQAISKHYRDEQKKRDDARKAALEKTARETERAQQVGLSIGESITQGFKSAFEADNFRDVIRSILGVFSRVASFIPGGQVAGGVSSIFAGLFAKGGLIQGPGTGTSDSILARVSKGEFVNTAETVRRFGADFFERLNQGFIDLSVLPRYAAGGLVGAAASTATAAPAVTGQAPTVFIQAFDPESTKEALGQVWEPAQYRRGMSRQDSKTTALMRRRLGTPRAG